MILEEEEEATKEKVHHFPLFHFQCYLNKYFSISQEKIVVKTFEETNFFQKHPSTKTEVSGGFAMLSLAMPFVTPYSTIPKIFEKKVT